MVPYQADASLTNETMSTLDAVAVIVGAVPLAHLTPVNVAVAVPVV